MIDREARKEIERLSKIIDNHILYLKPHDTLDNKIRSLETEVEYLYNILGYEKKTNTLFSYHTYTNDSFHYTKMKPLMAKLDALYDSLNMEYKHEPERHVVKAKEVK